MITPRIHPKYVRSAELGREITELCGYLYAATYRLLVKIREFDRDGLWQLEGIHSCAHWLNWKCGIGMNAAREKVRVANALAALPKISEAFSKGKVSYSKVRAMTRIAAPKNEDYLLMIATHGTAYHIESLVAKYRRCERLKDSQNAVRQQQSRETWYTYDHDGSLVFHGRLPPEQGALVLKALEKAVQRADGEVSADKRPRVAYRAFMADALVELAESYLEHGCESSSTADRYQVVVHVSAETLRSGAEGVSAETPAVGSAETPVMGSAVGSPAVRAPTAVSSELLESGVTDGCVSAETSAFFSTDFSFLEDGPHVSAETSRRLACDASVVTLLDDENGEPLSIGRKSRVIPPAIRRALRFRDQGCRFPGCTHRHFVDGHHIKHWADGGETSLRNLVQLCRFHHRLVHERDFGCQRAGDGRIVFTNPVGNEITRSCPLPSIP
ncbi:MAG: DUF222 domain-containing protein, partial [Woeseiaceae bacterium]